MDWIRTDTQGQVSQSCCQSVSLNWFVPLSPPHDGGAVTKKLNTRFWWRSRFLSLVQVEFRLGELAPTILSETCGADSSDRPQTSRLSPSPHSPHSASAGWRPSPAEAELWSKVTAAELHTDELSSFTPRCEAAGSDVTAALSWTRQACKDGRFLFESQPCHFFSELKLRFQLIVTCVRLRGSHLYKAPPFSRTMMLMVMMWNVNLVPYVSLL